ncbi:hypothetical protein NLU13_3319 [Sarocladium strictum]|uniref:Uncharacterized protein n=1 Tax=Sarocladium strictum TaxID=5046 RepID=A0AA39L9M4_SARSR|nr:hypothetical protein NLU13_3319 [Sarocladium strictum]
MRELARNCTRGDLSRAYTALAKLCDDTRKENAGLEHAIMDRSLDNVPTDHDSRIIVRWPSSDAATSAAESKVQSQQRRSSSSSSKRYSWLRKDLGVDGFFLGSIFAERAVRFALSGLLFTTLTSFIFL